jgi:hypothetical protein
MRNELASTTQGCPTPGLQGRQRQSCRLVATAVALALCTALAACGESEGGDAVGGAGANAPTSGTQSAGNSPLVWNECPTDAETVNAVTGLSLTQDQTACTFRDGVRVVSINVLGASVDPREDYKRQGMVITDIDRGDYAFVGTKETEAQAYVVVGDLSLDIGLLSFDLDAAGYRALAVDLVDAILRGNPAP